MAVVTLVNHFFAFFSSRPEDSRELTRHKGTIKALHHDPFFFISARDDHDKPKISDAVKLVRTN